MKSVLWTLAVALVIAVMFSQTSCKWGGGPLAGGKAGIRIGVASPGTTVYIDGSRIGTVQRGRHGPIAYVSPGEHKLVAKAAGYEPFAMPVFAHVGQMSTYDLPLLSEWTPVAVK